MRVVFSFIFSILFTSCSSYHLGMDQELPFSSIYITPVVNNTQAPQTQALFSKVLRDQFVQEPSLVLVGSEQNAGAVLNVEISSYDRNMSAHDEDTDLARSYQLKIVASCSLLDARSGQVYFRNRSLDIKTTAYNEDHISRAQNQNFPSILDALAKKIVEEVVGVW